MPLGSIEERNSRGVKGRGKVGGNGPIQARYKPGFYQIISCHTDDDAAAEPTPSLAFPVNAAANQSHLCFPFSPFHPLYPRWFFFSVYLSFTVPLLRLVSLFLAQNLLCSSSSVFNHPSLSLSSPLSLSIFLLLYTCLCHSLYCHDFPAVHDTGSSSASGAPIRKEPTTRGRFAVCRLMICM